MSQPSSTLEPIVLVCAADDRYAMPLAVTVTSVAVNHKGNRPILLFVIDGGISTKNRSKIERTIKRHGVELKWVIANQDKIKNLFLDGHLSSAAYCRLLIPDLLPADLNKALYLDSDVVVLDDIEELWNQDIGTHSLLAVPDLYIRDVSSHLGLSNYKELGIPANHKYFNSGVLVLNLIKWRDEGIGQKVINYIEKNHTLMCLHDQEGLNAVLFDDWQEVHPRWNRLGITHRYKNWQDTPYSEKLFRDLLAKPAIIHFVDSGKPWTPGCHHPEKHYFFHYLDQTAWSGWQIRFDIWFHRVQVKVYKLWRNAFNQMQPATAKPQS